MPSIFLCYFYPLINMRCSTSNTRRTRVLDVNSNNNISFAFIDVILCFNNFKVVYVDVRGLKLILELPIEQ